MAYFIDSVAVTEEEFEKRLPEIKLHSKEVNEYVSKVNSGSITINDVPETHREEVESIINPPEPQPSDDYTAGYDQAVLDMIESGVL